MGERTYGKVVAGGPSKAVGPAKWWIVERGRQGSSWWTQWSHVHVQINREEQLGSEADCATQGSISGK